MAVVVTAEVAWAVDCRSFAGYDTTQLCVPTASQLITPNMGFTIPSECACAWDKAVNGNFTILDNQSRSVLQSCTVTGAWTLTNVPYVQSASANASHLGFIRQGDADLICWRNNENSADLCLGTLADDVIAVNNLQMTVTEPVNGTININGNNTYYLCNPTLGAVTFNLPSCGSSAAGFQAFVKRIVNNANTCTVVPNGADKIEGSNSSITIANSAAPFHGCQLVCDAAGGWWEVSAASGGCP